MDNFFENGFSVNYDQIIASNNYCSIVKMLALQIKMNPYTTVGEFFKGLSDDDIQYLVDMVEKSNALGEEDTEEEYESSGVEDLMLLSLMLSRAEGGEEECFEEIQQKLNSLCLLIITTSLHRKGLVDVFYENYSLQEDARSRPVAQRKEDLDYDTLFGEEDDEEDE